MTREATSASWCVARARPSRRPVRGLLQAIREAALRAVGYREESGFGPGVAQRLEKVGRTAGRTALLDLWNGLMDMEPELRKGADARLLLELTLLRSMQPVAALGVETGRPVV